MQILHEEHRPGRAREIGPETNESVKDLYATLQLDMIAVKGKKEGVRIFTILDDVSRCANGGSVEHHNTFLTYYRAQRWDDALK